MEHKELDFEKACRAWARQNGWVAWKNEKNRNKGIPDDSFLHASGAFVMVEFKKDEKQKPRDEQKRWLEKFPNTCFLCGNFDHFKEILQAKIQGKK